MISTHVATQSRRPRLTDTNPSKQTSDQRVLCVRPEILEFRSGDPVDHQYRLLTLSSHAGDRETSTLADKLTEEWINKTAQYRVRDIDHAKRTITFASKPKDFQQTFEDHEAILWGNLQDVLGAVENPHSEVQWMTDRKVVEKWCHENVEDCSKRYIGDDAPIGEEVTYRMRAVFSEVEIEWLNVHPLQSVEVGERS